MKETNLSLRRFLYFSVFVICVFLFMFVRFFQLYFHTNLETGICENLKFFSIIFACSGVLFFIMSFVFFKFFYKPKLEGFNEIKVSHKFFGFLGFIVSAVILVCSFALLLGTKTKFSCSPTFNLLNFLTGICFAAALFYASICFISDKNINYALIFLFFSSFAWTISRMFSLILTNSYLIFNQIEYKFSVAGLMAMFLFLFYLGQLIFNLNITNASVGVLSCGFFEVLVVFASVIPKIAIKIYNSMQNIHFSSLYFNRNIDIFNFYNFNLVDLIISIFTLIFLVYYMFCCNKNKNKVIS